MGPGVALRDWLRHAAADVRDVRNDGGNVSSITGILAPEVTDREYSRVSRKAVGPEFAGTVGALAVVWTANLSVRAVEVEIRIIGDGEVSQPHPDPVGSWRRDRRAPDESAVFSVAEAAWDSASQPGDVRRR